MFSLSLTAFQLVLYDLGREERTSENMDMSDGLLLQVNNGEQWCNRWKYPNDDLVSRVARPSRLCDAFPLFLFFPPFAAFAFYFGVYSFASRTEAPARLSCAVWLAHGKKVC